MLAVYPREAVVEKRELEGKLQHYRLNPMYRLALGGSVWGMDKKEINSPKLTLNFLIWVGGVFMLLLFAFLAHFVWRIF
jgi:hypothetical protein